MSWGEGDEQGATLGLTSGPHMQRRWLPNRLPHRPGERAAPTRWRLGHAELGRHGSGPRREGEGRSRPRGGGGGRRLGCGRLAGPRRETGEGERAGRSWAAPGKPTQERGVWGFFFLFFI
jgi:hypothetical protein